MHDLGASLFKTAQLRLECRFVDWRYCDCVRASTALAAPCHGRDDIRLLASGLCPFEQLSNFLNP
jgi:hypothetical protein